MTANQDQMEFIIPSDFKFLGAVDAAVQDLAREMSCEQRWINDFSTALVEGCSNAIEHGNKYAKDKIVRVVVRLNGRQITARIHDQGDGFDHEGFLSKSAPPDPFSERGRGILIMQAFTDAVSFSKSQTGGTCLELVKSCQDEGSDAADASSAEA